METHYLPFINLIIDHLKYRSWGVVACRCHPRCMFLLYVRVQPWFVLKSRIAVRTRVMIFRRMQLFMLLQLITTQESLTTSFVLTNPTFFSRMNQQVIFQTEFVHCSTAQVASCRFYSTIFGFMLVLFLFRVESPRAVVTFEAHLFEMVAGNVLSQQVWAAIWFGAVGVLACVRGDTWN